MKGSENSLQTLVPLTEQEKKKSPNILISQSSVRSLQSEFSSFNIQGKLRSLKSFVSQTALDAVDWATGQNKNDASVQTDLSFLKPAHDSSNNEIISGNSSCRQRSTACAGKHVPRKIVGLKYVGKKKASTNLLKNKSATKF